RPSACPYTTLFRSYKKMENTEINPAMKFKFTKTNVPAIPINTLKTNACPVVILPAGNGRSIVRFINLSMSFSMISLKPFAAPVTKNPPIVNNNQLNHMISPCCFAPIKNEIDAENTTVNVKRNFTSLLKSEIKVFIECSFSFSPLDNNCICYYLSFQLRHQKHQIILCSEKQTC